MATFFGVWVTFEFMALFAHVSHPKLAVLDMQGLVGCKLAPLINSALLKPRCRYPCVGDVEIAIPCVFPVLVALGPRREVAGGAVKILSLNVEVLKVILRDRN